MPVFVWEGTSASGARVKGEMDALNAQAVFNSLRAQRIKPSAKHIRPKSMAATRQIKIPGFEPVVKTRDMVVFTRQFSTMIDAGLPIVQGLDVLGRGHDNPAMRDTLLGIKEEVQTGSTLSYAMSKYPKAFDDLFVNMIAAGETGGILDVILERMAEYLEKAASLKRQAKTAMIYPAIVVSAAVIVTAILLIFVIPTFADLFGDAGAALPAPTRFVIGISNFMVNYYHLMFGTLLGFIWLLRRFLKTPRGKEIVHPLLLKSPIFGEIIRKIAVARFSRTLGTMLSSGVPILDALQICARTSGNKVVEKEIIGVRMSISEGKTIAEPLMSSVVFPPMVVQMIAVGESTGALDAMLQKVADFYEDEVENAVNGLKQLIEPLMIIFLGLVVGGLVVSMYLPIFKMGDVI